MSAANFPINVKQGSTWAMSMTFTDSNGNPIDVSGWTFAGQIRAEYDSATILASMTFAGGSSSNIMVATISAATSASIPVNASTDYHLTPTKYAYDIKATKQDLSEDPILQGTAIITPGVTK